ncbi:EF-hand calcium-binding domain-containing protein 7-like isoform X1 [Octopus sinensis]|uniref:EF-hand calcium-binding domain-containing protein 7-like isoform X1 n=1 Tax=Octopus sinensis TaxID=2607531 RepID=A0A7E6F0W2_9MOLL|nr:EF-hand calcium-binding domain-containing protein 7-like isoform X1 [Octopus sinensis]
MSTPQPLKRTFHNSNKDDEFILDCKAAYLSVFKSIKDSINSLDDLVLVLQQTGRNPSKKSLEKYRKQVKASLSFDDFCKICSDEPQTTTNEVLQAFRCLDTDGDGYISYTKLLNLMTTKGEKMSSADAKILMEELNIDSNGMIDYKKFSKTMEETILKTKELSKALMNSKFKNPTEMSNSASSMNTSSTFKTSLSDSTSSPEKIVEIKSQNENISFENDVIEESIIINDDNNDDDDDDDIVIPTTSSTEATEIKRDSLNKSADQLQLERKTKTLSAAVEASTVPDPKTIELWTHLKSCGCFFLENTEISSHHFKLSLPNFTNVWFTIHPVFGPENLSKEDPQIDTMLCIFKYKPDGTKSFLALSEMKTKSGRFCVRCDLSAGHYILIPFTTGCRFRPRSTQPQEVIPLVKKSSSGEITLTSPFKKSLEKIFDLCDLDKNGKLSRKELSFFHYCTSGEQLTAQEWQIVEERFDLNDGELTQLGFLNLHEMEAEDNNGDAEDLWITLDSMGLNRALVLDQAFQFELNVFLEESPEAILDVLNVESGGVDLEKAICESVINKGFSWNVGNAPDILIHEYHSDARYTAVIQNLSKDKVTTRVDNTGSMNCCSNTNQFKNTVDVQPSSCKVCQFLVPCNEKETWTVECSATVV